MNFEYKKETNIREGQILYGIIAVSTTTYDGVHKVEVDEVDWNKEIVIFKVDQPCEYVSCEFEDMECFVFETKDEAEIRQKTFRFGEGMHNYYED